MCEVGGHRAGLKAAGIQAQDLSVLSNGAKCSSTQNYLSCWDFRADASQPGVRQLREPIVHGLTSNTCHPQLEVQVFSFSGKAKVVQGNLHIRTPSGATISRATRKRLVQEALRLLDSAAVKEKERANDDASQPVVCVLLGDTNLQQPEGEEAVQCLQPQSDPQWDHGIKPIMEAISGKSSFNPAPDLSPNPDLNSGPSNSLCYVSVAIQFRSSSGSLCGFGAATL